MAQTDDPGWSHPSPGLWRLRLTEVSVVTVVLALLASVLFDAAFGYAAGLLSVAGIFAGGALFGLFAHNRYRAWGYQEQHEDLRVTRGVLMRRLSVVPYGRMQFVEVTAGPFERMFKLSTVKLHTAAAASDARIPGLERPEAARLRDRLTELGESMAAGM
jgi:membrane protein YdbS with pleckstrin-like domain